MKTKNVIFCGGGSGGHVLPAITLIRKIQKLPEFKAYYIGSKSGIERRLILKEGISYHAISTGKLRRYFSINNIIDLFRIVFGVVQSFLYLFSFPRKSSIVFCTGGFVTVPVVIAAFFQRKKIYIHEQTTRAGLANKINSFFADKIFVSFEESLAFFKSKKVFLSGYPLRDDLFSLETTPVTIKNVKLNEVEKPILFITGGGNGSYLLNNVIEDNLEKLTKDYFVLHQVGSQFINHYEEFSSDSYLPVDFIGKEMIGVLKKAKVIVSRSGAGTVCELIALGKKSIFVPLKIAQKNEQYHNAKSAQKLLGSIIVEEDKFNYKSLLKAIEQLNDHDQNVEKKNLIPNGTSFLMNEIQEGLI